MKNFQQNLLILLALGLCGLCVWQWRGQTAQREEINRLNQGGYDKSAAIQGYTNSIKTLEHQVMQMDGQITALRATVKTNEAAVLSQQREINRLDASAQALDGQIAEYKKAVETLQAKLKDAYDGVAKQNETIKGLVAERDEYVKKYNDSVTDRNDVVKKYNELVEEVKKSQAAKGPDRDK